MDTPGCPLCPIYRPDTDPRRPARPQVCDPDRARLGRDLTDLTDLHARLANPTPDPTRPTAVEMDERGRRREVWAAADINSGPIRGRSDQPHVGGSREAPVPVDLTTVDLTAAARRAAGDVCRRSPWTEDQIGHLSVATVLDHWVRTWRADLWPDHHLPVPTVAELAGWLHNRVEPACDLHPDIDRMAADVHRLRGVLRAVLGETDPQPTPVIGVACRDCDLRALVRRPGDDYEAECSACGLLYTLAELREWIGRLAGYERSKRSGDEVADLLRPGPVTSTAKS